MSKTEKGGVGAAVAILLFLAVLVGRGNCSEASWRASDRIVTRSVVGVMFKNRDEYVGYLFGVQSCVGKRPVLGSVFIISSVGEQRVDFLTAEDVPLTSLPCEIIPPEVDECWFVYYTDDRQALELKK